LRNYSTGWKVAGLRPDKTNAIFFSIYLILPSALGPRVYSAPNKNEYQKQKIVFLESRDRPVRMSDNLTAICEKIV
jgi:hypothetical protein